jgi:hypothetical protein
VAGRLKLLPEHLELEDCKGFIKWYNNAVPNAMHVYHTGFIGMDGSNSPLKHLVWQYAVAGRVYLVQKKLFDLFMPEYKYIAIKAKERIPRLIADDYHTGKK